jgi:MerR family transcriptional regulator, thiopeptide resistance regulator
MDESKTYSVGEFARVAGVTVRTLHFYDEAGLLKPIRHKDNQRRQYQQTDLLRLQQILTLKYLGFSLGDIEALLSNPVYNVQESLRIQCEAISRQITQLQAVYYAVSKILETMEAGKGTDWEQVTAIIQSLTDQDKNEWMRRYYPPEEWDWLRDRAVQFPPELVEISTKAWAEVYEGLQVLRHLPPDHPEVQAVAERAQRLGQMFTQSKPEIEAALRTCTATSRRFQSRTGWAGTTRRCRISSARRSGFIENERDYDEI